ncbi:hypothetical protein CRENBAI_008667 [Crenichthys baileyi]|uniref:Uncharacterized protein n=1 Tax=Crenichthys baileyi TaxID=28760 RepID=A0AAV9S7J3_9TELE
MHSTWGCLHSLPSLVGETEALVALWAGGVRHRFSQTAPTLALLGLSQCCIGPHLVASSLCQAGHGLRELCWALVPAAAEGCYLPGILRALEGSSLLGAGRSCCWGLMRALGCWEGLVTLSLTLCPGAPVLH